MSNPSYELIKKFISKALSSKAVDIGTIKYPAPEPTQEDVIYVTPSQLAK